MRALLVDKCLSSKHLITIDAKQYLLNLGKVVLSFTINMLSDVYYAQKHALSETRENGCQVVWWKVTGTG